jgi:HAD superfamily hydrolase (TIGR01549 family)
VLYRDAWPALRRLRRHCRLVLVTDGIAAVQHVKLARTGLDSLFEHVIISAEAGYRKPDPALLRVGLRRAGVPASEALVVGDSLVSDGAGAAAAGIDFCWVNRSAAAGPANASFVVDDLTALAAQLTRPRAVA